MAGLVDGSFTASRFVAGRQYFLYKLKEVAPLQKICRISAASRIRFKSLGTTFFMELSLEPVISQEAMTSHTAM